ncbi:MAG: MMPL family transporter [Paludibacteraceae bacterium]|nr:MMPL family transporter [Paludibacteraceae bacterium]
MNDKLLHIYDWLSTHRRWLWSGLTIVLIPLIVLALTLRYNEDIMDFLPLEDEDREALKEFQSRQSAAQIVLIVEGGNESLREEAIEELANGNGLLDISTDPSDQLRSLYAQLPYYIEEEKYEKLDSLFTAEAIRAALERDKRILATPGTGFLATAIQSDPLGLMDLSAFSAQQVPNRSYAFITSPYGSTETQRNTSLLDSLNGQLSIVHSQFPELSLRFIGAPVIAVENARRIKLDSLICIALSLVLIVALLAYAFPRRRDLWLIVLSVSFGWLTGMAVLRIFTPTVSAMVLGIGSVLIGIAVNYPLHLLVHQRYTRSVRQTLEEVLSPLVVGNITTVGAFLALLPLKATAMQHLGIFAAAMLVGTIVFCIFVLPHLMSAHPTPLREIKLPRENLRMGNHELGMGTLVVTCLLGLFLVLSPLFCSPKPLFNPDPSSINYMTAQQRADIAFFDSVANPMRQVADHATRAERWTAYWQTHDAEAVIGTIDDEAAQVGFKRGVFAPFYQMMRGWKPAKSFDFSRLTQGLSDNFDYIGIACSLIVFLFLWLSFRSLKVALIAFVPMMLSWVWIVAIMQIFGLQFNIVNIILATFIFGQGDDYTIFIVEGLLYERRTGQTILPQYKQSIMLSALIMLIGIGILVFAVHPAMHSLGVVTLIGMSVVLLMAVTIPPFLFRFIKAI